MLEQDETIRLIGLAQQGDQEAKAVLLEHNSPLIKSILRRYRNRGVEYDDLFQLGCIGLLKAIQNFSTAFNVRFSTYAVPMIMGEIKRYIRDDGYIKVSRATKTLAGKIAYYAERIKNEESRTPTVEETAKHFGVEPQEIAFAMDAVKIPVSIYDKGGDEQNQSLLERLTDGDGTDDTIDKLLIKEIIQNLDERERKIIVMRYYKDKTQSEVAKYLNVSQVQISRLESKIIGKLKAGFRVNIP